MIFVWFATGISNFMFDATTLRHSYFSRSARCSVVRRWSFVGQHRVSRIRRSESAVRKSNWRKILKFFSSFKFCFGRKLEKPFGLNVLNARNAEIVIVDSIWDALCLFEATGKVSIVLPQGKVAIKVKNRIFERTFLSETFLFSQIFMALEHLRKIHIWCSDDKPFAFRLANLFNPHRCFMITFVVECSSNKNKSQISFDFQDIRQLRNWPREIPKT